MKEFFRINILTEHVKSTFSHQEPIDKFENYIFYENGDPNLTYDLIVVYENIRKPTEVNCDPSNLLFISGEPPLSRAYTGGFLKQFNFVLSSHPSLKHPHHIQAQQALPWHFGFDFNKLQFKYNYAYLDKMRPNKKEKVMSVIASNKGMLPGHKKRYSFVQNLKKIFPNEIDFFGKGINSISDKANAILPYSMTICIENSTINNYWTEKLADAFLGFSLPIYSGCTNITDFFPEKSMVLIDINNQEKAINDIRWLLKNNQEIYKERKPYILLARKMLMEEYNIYPTIVNFFEREKCFDRQRIEKIVLHPNQSFNTYKSKLALLKIKRTLIKSVI